MYDFHVHSSFSGDCKYTMEDMLKGALQKGVKQICFTDHLDFEYGEDLIDFVFDKAPFNISSIDSPSVLPISTRVSLNTLGACST